MTIATESPLPVELDGVSIRRAFDNPLVRTKRDEQSCRMIYTALTNPVGALTNHIESPF